MPKRLNPRSQWEPQLTILYPDDCSRLGVASLKLFFGDTIQSFRIMDGNTSNVVRLAKVSTSPQMAFMAPIY